MTGIIIFVFQNNPKNYPSNANWADKIFYFLDDWASASASLFTTIGIIAALSIGVISLLQTQNIQKVERKERLLNEIMDWVSVLTKSRFVEIFDEFIKIRTEQEKHQIIYTYLPKWSEQFRSHAVVGYYIIEISKIFGKDIQRKIEELNEELLKAVKYLDEWYNKASQEKDVGKYIKKEYSDEAEQHDVKINNMAIDILRNIALLKAGTIGS